MPIDYSKAKIYKLVNSVSNDCYYGSTCQRLSDRKCGHKGDFKLWKNQRGHKCSSAKLFDEDYDNVDIILVENYPCKSKDELHARERWYIENNDCLNKCLPGRTEKEYRQANIEKIKGYQKNYRFTNKEAIKKQVRQYYQANKDAIKEQVKQYYQANENTIKKQKKKYYRNNADKIKEYSKQYKEANKEKIQEKGKQKANCPHCEKEMRKDSIKRHIRTQHEPSI